MADQPSDAAPVFQATDEVYDPLTDEVTEEGYVERTGPSLAARLAAEAAGTFVLVVLGVGMAAFGSAIGNGSLTVGFGFGIALLGIVVAFGHISGAHVNPAVTVGAWIAGRFPGRDVAPYILAQVVGGTAGAATLFAFANSDSAFASTGKETLSAVSIGWGEHSPAGFGFTTAFIAEAIGAGLLVAIVLAATSIKASKVLAPVSIGLGLLVLIVWTVPFSNAGINPARATATSLFADSWAIGQLWAWWVAPVIGAAIVGLLYRAFGPDEDILALASADDEAAA